MQVLALLCSWWGWLGLAPPLPAAVVPHLHKCRQGSHGSHQDLTAPPFSHHHYLKHVVQLKQCPGHKLCAASMACKWVLLKSFTGSKVFRRVLYGSMRVRGLDWLPEEEQPPMGSDRLAAVALETTLDSDSQPAVLFPSTGGNIHQFTAVTPSAVLDVLSPPYSPGTGEISGAFACET